MASMHVRDYWSQIDKEHGSEIAKKFRSLMIEWDRRHDVLDAFYDIDVLKMKKREAIESINGYKS